MGKNNVHDTNVAIIVSYLFQLLCRVINYQLRNRTLLDENAVLSDQAHSPFDSFEEIDVDVV